MLLSIDRVLQLLAEGKSLNKISELAKCEAADVVALIEEARELIHRHEKASGRRKVIIRKKEPDTETVLTVHEADMQREVMSGAELAAVPVNSSLTMYINGISDGNPGNAGIGIVIFDREDRQVGKVCDFIGRRSDIAAEYVALNRALKLAEYFRVSELKIRTNSKQIIRQIGNPGTIKSIALKQLAEDAITLIKGIRNFRIEFIPSSQNDKADYLARKGSEKSR